MGITVQAIQERMVVYRYNMNYSAVDDISIFSIFNGVGMELLLSAGGSGSPGSTDIEVSKSLFTHGGFKVSIELAMDVAMDLHPNENQRV
ncbi:hypothetical protein C5167_028051 [Papaver somniferum]|nr:hypothetical protein C5167_028051 [Papaver somniferum]